MKFSMTLILFAIALLARSVHAAEEIQNGLHPTYGGFIDTYFGLSTTPPKNFDRQYTTQALREDEFNLNLAFLEAKIESDRVHGRLALQAGTSVQNNYASEPTNGVTSGSSLSRNIQEAYAGYRAGAKTWIDAGIMFSHLGLESFISRDNPVYTRSLVADFSPYYQSGVRITHEWNEKWSGQFLILNGWQNISETNRDKAIGTQLTFTLSPTLSLSYNTFFGKDVGFRQFHDLVAKYSVNSNWNLSAQVDYGHQDQTLTSTNGASWHGFTLISRHALDASHFLAIRLENYDDSSNVIVATPNNDPFRAWAVSIGLDTNLTTALVWRSEAREIFADHAIYLTRAQNENHELFLVSSLGFSF
jgi:hypothetical protein